MANNVYLAYIGSDLFMFVYSNVPTINLEKVSLPLHSDLWILKILPRQ